MSTARTMIRPRTRPQSPQPGGGALSTTESNAALAPNANDKSSLPILIRLPEVAIPHSTKLALRLDWLAKLDWNHIRRVKLDPNWVAGGLLGLVLFLLIMITLNRGSKPDPNTPAQNERHRGTRGTPNRPRHQPRVSAPPTALSHLREIPTRNSAPIRQQGHQTAG